MDQQSSVNALQIVTLVIAVLGLVLSVVAVVWQVLSWRLTGAVVKVDTQLAVIITGTGSVGDEVIAVTVRNVGRSPVAVGRCGIKMPDGTTMIVPVALPWQGPSYPHTLNGGHDATWYFGLDEVRAHLTDSERTATEVRGVVGLATGKNVESKNALKVT